MPLSVRLDVKTEKLIERLVRQRRQTKSEVVRKAIFALAAKGNVSKGKIRPYDLVAHLIGSVKGGPRDLSTRTGNKYYEMLVDQKKRGK